MCGIIACIYENAYSILLQGLLQLQNRGYDSAGITILNYNCLITEKKASTSNKNAIQFLSDVKINGNIGIGHTRWATHGPKTDINSHPHISNCNRFSLVHNGIIENYKEIKELLEKNGYVMKSQTDSEVIVNLLSFHFDIINNVEDALLKVIETLEGTWGLVILYNEEPNNLYTTRNGSPILIGYNKDNVIVTSEQSGFL